MEDLIHQSTLNSATDSSASLIQELAWVMYVGGAAILIIVMSLTMYGVMSAPRRVDTRRWIFGAGLLFPVVTLIALLAYSIKVSGALHTHVSSDALRVHVIAKQWWWEVRYQLSNGQWITLANELHVPVDRHIEINLTTDDVIHSFWVPALAGKVDMIPGRSNRLVLYTSQEGVYRGVCAEYCGLQHALMAFYVIAESEKQFDAWIARQAEPISLSTFASPQSGSRSGSELFFSSGCAECHTVRGTNAKGTLGPDLTHVGGRFSLGAGVLRNHIGTMAGWIADAQNVKPGNAMPSTEVLSGQELRVLSEWLGSLQ